VIADRSSPIQDGLIATLTYFIEASWCRNPNGSVS
jgi:hypothetical protein